MGEKKSKVSLAPVGTGTGFDTVAAARRSVAKRMSEPSLSRGQASFILS